MRFLVISVSVPKWIAAFFFEYGFLRIYEAQNNIRLYMNSKNCQFCNVYICLPQISIIFL